MKKLKWLWGVFLFALLVVGGWYGYQHFIQPSVRQEQQVKRVEKRHVKLVAVGDSLTYGQGDEKKNGGYVGLIKKKNQKKKKKKAGFSG